MARRSGLYLALLILAGCNTPPIETNHLADSGAASAAQTKTPSTTLPEPVVNTQGNPSRVHQLKDLKRVDVSLNGHTVHLWLMDDAAKQEEGMMFLTDPEVKADEGMLFAFKDVQPNDGQHSFWMHNTILPLDIIYFSPAGKVLNVGHGKPMTDTPPVPPTGDYLNVIELKAGTAAKDGLKAGDLVKIPKV